MYGTNKKIHFHFEQYIFCEFVAVNCNFFHQSVVMIYKNISATVDKWVNGICENVSKAWSLGKN